MGLYLCLPKYFRLIYCENKERELNIGGRDVKDMMARPMGGKGNMGGEGRTDVEGMEGTARATCPVLNSTVLRCVLKTRTLRMNPTRTTIAHIAHPRTCDVARTHGTWILGSRARILVHIT